MSYCLIEEDLNIIYANLFTTEQVIYKRTSLKVWCLPLLIYLIRPELIESNNHTYMHTHTHTHTHMHIHTPSPRTHAHARRACIQRKRERGRERRERGERRKDKERELAENSSERNLYIL